MKKLKKKIDILKEKNEKEIKECKIFVNDIKIYFSYYYIFPNE